MQTISEILWSSINQYASYVAIYDVDKKNNITFLDILRETASIAGYLQEKGVRQDDRVAIVLGREKDYLLAELTCLLYGYCAVLLDKSYPKERIDLIIADAKVSCVIDDTFMNEARLCTKKPQKRLLKASDPAIIIYTSGTTNKPKGVLHSQSSIADTVLRNISYFEIKANEIYGMVAPFTFIASCAELVCSFAKGRGVVIVSYDVIRNPNALACFINDMKINALFIPPKVLKYFKKQGDSLNLVVTGSERIYGVVGEDYRLVAMYGMTETCSQVSVFEVDKPYDNTPIGKAMPNVSMYILDENLNECDLGEICVCGNFMTEYIGDPEETSCVKIENPYFKKDGHKYMIRTGDVGMKDAEGNIIYLNRKDYIVKINGNRVDLGEVETSMRSLPEISDAVVKAFQDKDGKIYLCAYYVSNIQIAKNKIMLELKKTLLDYMIPTFLIEMEALPTNRNGKIDRQALKEPVIDNFQAEYIPPQTEMEQKICTAMEQVFGISRVGINDNFFDLGGDSLSCVDMVTKLDKMGIDIDIKKIYLYQTPQQIALHTIMQKDTDYNKLNKDALSHPQELMPYQKYYLEYNQRFSEITIANQVLLCSIEINTIDVCKFVKVVNDVLRNHPIYSTVFMYDAEAQYVQKYCPDLFEEIKLMRMPDDEVMSYILKIEVKPFTLINRLLYRCKIIQSEKKVHLLFDMHHTIMDGMSLKKLILEIFDCYNGQKMEQDYYYLALENYSRYKNKAEYQKHLKILKELHSNDTYARHPIPDFSDNQNKSKGLFFDSGYSFIQLTEKAREKNTTVGTFFVATTLLALSKYNKQSKVSTEWIFNGRNEKWKDNIQANLLQGILVSIDMDTVVSIDDLLQNIKTQNETGIKYSDVSYPQLEAIPNETEWMQVIYEHELSEIKGLPDGVNISRIFEPVTGNLSMIQLIIYETQQGQNQNLILAYNTNRYKEKSMIRFAEYIKDSLHEIMES